MTKENQEDKEKPEVDHEDEDSDEEVPTVLHMIM